MNIVQKNILINLTENLFFKTIHKDFNKSLNDFRTTKLNVLKIFLNNESIQYIEEYLISSVSSNSLISNIKPPLLYPLTPKYCFDLIYNDNIFDITSQSKEEHKKEKEKTTKYNTSLFDKIIKNLNNFFGELSECLNPNFKFDISNFINNKKNFIHTTIGKNELEWRILNIKKYNPGFLYNQDKKSYDLIDLNRAKARFNTALNNINIEDNLGFILGDWKENFINEIIKKTQNYRDTKQIVCYMKQK